MILETPYEMAVDVAKRFRKMRIAKKITIKELSERSGVPYSTIRRFESSGQISFLPLVKMASVLDEDEQITSLFAETRPRTIEDVIHENRVRPGR